MRTRRSLTLTAILTVTVLALGASASSAQALPNLNSTRVRYNTLKSTVKPEGELKTQIEQIDRELADAMRHGRSGDVRRLFAKGLALLNGQPWTDVDEFGTSLVLRTNAVVIDSSRVQTVRLEQIFAPAIALSQPLTAIASIRPLLTQPTGGVPPAPAPSTELGRFDQVARDLRESPLAMDLNLANVSDGPHVIEVEVKDGERSLGTVALRVSMAKGIGARLARLESAALAAHTDVRADLRYPADYIRKIDRGVVELAQFDVAMELAAAETLAASAKGGKNPFAGRPVASSVITCSSPPARSCRTASTCRPVTTAAARSRSSSRSTASAPTKTRSWIPTPRRCRRSPSSAATSSSRRWGFASTAFTASACRPMRRRPIAAACS